MTKKVKSLNGLDSVRRYLRRIGAEPRSMLTAIIKEIHGKYWQDVQVIKFDKLGVVDYGDNENYKPTEVEEAEIVAEFATVEFPSSVRLKRLPSRPEMIEKADPEDVFEFWSADGEFIMFQLRINNREAGEKSYIPFTYWDDKEWRNIEPEGPLPLWGAEQLDTHSVVFIHEGAKAARFARRLAEGKTKKDREECDAHPWGQELKNAAHVGWIGGALSPYRTDWRQLKIAGIQRAYIVSDNDTPGRRAVPDIAFRLRFPTFHVQFTEEWPVSFDLADPFPKAMFKKIDGVVQYVGPSFRQCLHPATWATDSIQGAKGRPRIVLRDGFREMWEFCEGAEQFVCIDLPHIHVGRSQFNAITAPFSHADDTAKLVIKSFQGRSVDLAYRPDLEERIITNGSTSAVNLHMPGFIKPLAGDFTPWTEYLEYMFPDPKERHEVMRWCATLIARPDIRMEYGLLLVSEMQGIGKTTLGERILMHIVGPQNFAAPSESTIVDSTFNSWIANKRLIFVNEIYSGHSWKAYNKLKSLITDRVMEVNEKFMKPYRIENWAHVIACSNSKKALKLDVDDRRWFYPKVAEVKQTPEWFGNLFSWLESGGLSIIYHWALQWDDYVQPGTRAPDTDEKKRLIEDSRSSHLAEIVNILEALGELETPGAISWKMIDDWIRDHVEGKNYDDAYAARRAAKDLPVAWAQLPIKIRGRKDKVVMNRAMLLDVRASKAEGYVIKGLAVATIDDLSTEEASAVLARIRDNLIEIKDLLPETM